MTLFPITLLGWVALWFAVVFGVAMAMSALFAIRIPSAATAQIEIPSAMDDWDAEFERVTGSRPFATVRTGEPVTGPWRHVSNLTIRDCHIGVYVG